MKLITKITATIGLMVAVTLALYCLKLLHVAPVVAWPWWAVYGPLWMPQAILIAGAVLLLCGVGGDRAIKRLEKWAAQ